MPYVINPGCGGPNGETLALAVSDTGAIVVEDASEVTLNLLWTLVYDVPSGGFAMVSASSVDSGQPAVLGLVDGGGGTSALTLTPYQKALTPETTWNVAAGGTLLAVRPMLSTSLNLNVSGTGPYPPGNPVIAYDGWGNGQPNEIWNFQAFGADDFPWTYAFVPMNAQSTLLTADPQDAGGQLTIQPPAGGDATASPAQLWSAYYQIDRATPVGVLFVNEELSMAMRTTPFGGAVFPVDPTDVDAWTLWRVGGAPDAGAWAVHSIGNDDLTLNVSGGGDAPGTPVITAPWQGGAENEQWMLTYVPHEVT